MAVNNREAARSIVSHVNHLGHRRLALLKARLDADTIEDRVRGDKEAPESADIPFDRSLIAECTSCAGILAAEPRPDAEFCTNNFMTPRHDTGHTGANLDCPGDIELAGFDDFPWATAFRPRLTAIAQSSYAIGCEAVRLLFDRITGSQRAPVCTTVDASLLIRDSCGAHEKAHGAAGWARPCLAGRPVRHVCAREASVSKTLRAK